MQIQEQSLHDTQQHSEHAKLVVTTQDTKDDEKGLQNTGPKPKQSFCKIFCGCKLKENTKSIFTRSPASIKELDGLRAMAILWVFALHVGYMWGGYFYVCGADKWYFKVLYLISKGDYGVDIFFVLSGFLIAYILLKECEKYGPRIDVWNFYRGRFLRLYPAMLVACLYLPLITPILYECLYTLIFVNNYLGPKSHLWSVAVEIQMYLISPFLVQCMFKWQRSRVWLVPFAICLIATIACFVTLFIGVPEVFETGDWLTPQESAGGMPGMVFYDRYIYLPVYTRVSPYGFGMYVAYLYLEQVKDSKIDPENTAQVTYMNKTSTRILEFIAFIIMLVLSYIGANPVGNSLIKLPPWLAFIQAGFSRQLYGLSLSYLVHLLLNPATKSGKVAWYRPSRIMQRWLSLDFWIPFATLSYSFYLLHIFPLIAQIFNNNDFLNPDYGDIPPVDHFLVTCWDGYYAVLGRWCLIFIWAFSLSALYSFIVYILIEKPSMDAKRVFKNKYAS